MVIILRIVCFEDFDYKFIQVVKNIYKFNLKNENKHAQLLSNCIHALKHLLFYTADLQQFFHNKFM